MPVSTQPSPLPDSPKRMWASKLTLRVMQLALAFTLIGLTFAMLDRPVFFGTIVPQPLQRAVDVLTSHPILSTSIPPSATSKLKVLDISVWQ
ncbi:hypothetical protein VTH82DRAFT_1649 [Thermothelomyces myriococcoides]